MTLADIDGEGNLDVIVALQGSSLTFALSDGLGGFFPPQVVVLSSGVRALDSGDVDGDGDADLVVGFSGAEIAVIRNIGIGFAPAETYESVPTGFFDEDANVQFADTDLDGDLDVVFSSGAAGDGPGGIGYGAIALFENDGSGALSGPVTIPLDPAGAGATDVAVADFTGDGWPDLAASTASDGRWCLLAGDGAGGFLAAESRFAGSDLARALHGDLDGNGELDLVLLARGSIEACVYLDPGAAQFAEPLLQDMVSPTLAPVSSTKLAAGDLDLDGDLDAVVGYSANFLGQYGISVRRNQGDGTLEAEELYAIPDFPTDLVVADLNQDAYPDVAWVDDPDFSGPRVRVMLNLGDGSFGPSIPLPGSFCGYEPDLDAADVDADGDVDLLLTECIDRVYVLLNTGAGFAPPLSQELTNSFDELVVGDLNLDGDPDLVTNSGIQGYVEISLGNGDGTFQPPFVQVSGRGVSDMAIADLNDDGIPDIAAAYTLDGDGVSVLLGFGDGTFGPSEEYHGTYSGGTDNVTVSDVDGDGSLDLLVANASSQDVSFWRNRGDGTFEPFRRYGAGRSATSLVHADWTGDGLSDLAVLVEPHGAGNWYYPALSILPGREALWTDLGQGLAGAHGVPVLTGAGTLIDGSNVFLELEGALESSVAFHVVGFASLTLPLLGGTLVPSPDAVLVIPTDLAGDSTLALQWPVGLPGSFELFFQTWILDGAAVQGVAASNAVRANQP